MSEVEMKDCSIIKTRIEEIDAVIVKQQEILNQTQANLLALTGARNELDRLMKVLTELKIDKDEEKVISARVTLNALGGEAAGNCC